MNGTSDYVEIIAQPAQRYPDTELVRQGADQDVIERSCGDLLFWEIQDSEGELQHVSVIHAVFSSQLLTGFIFEYPCQVDRSAGCIDGERDTMTLKDGERIVRVDLRKSLADKDGQHHLGFDKVVVSNAEAEYPLPQLKRITCLSTS
jgi:hypothetical protein